MTGNKMVSNAGLPVLLTLQLRFELLAWQHLIKVFYFVTFFNFFLLIKTLSIQSSLMAVVDKWI